MLCLTSKRLCRECNCWQAGALLGVSEVLYSCLEAAPEASRDAESCLDRGQSPCPDSCRQAAQACRRPQLRLTLSPVAASFFLNVDLTLPRPSSVLAALLPSLSCRREVFRSTPSAMATSPCARVSGFEGLGWFEPQSEPAAAPSSGCPKVHLSRPSATATHPDPLTLNPDSRSGPADRTTRGRTPKKLARAAGWVKAQLRNACG